MLHVLTTKLGRYLYELMDVSPNLIVELISQYISIANYYIIYL